MGEERIKVFLDGECYLCNFEGRLLRKADREGRLELVNIASPDFDPKKYEGLGPNYDRFMQARLPDGSYVEGIDAFSQIYRAIPKFRWLGFLLTLPLLRQLAWVGYRIFAWLRPKLPKRKNCEL